MSIRRVLFGGLVVICCTPHGAWGVDETKNVPRATPSSASGSASVQGSPSSGTPQPHEPVRAGRLDPAQVEEFINSLKIGACLIGAVFACGALFMFKNFISSREWRRRSRPTTLLPGEIRTREGRERPRIGSAYEKRDLDDDEGDDDGGEWEELPVRPKPNPPSQTQKPKAEGGSATD